MFLQITKKNEFRKRLSRSYELSYFVMEVQLFIWKIQTLTNVGRYNENLPNEGTFIEKYENSTFIKKVGST